MVEELALEQGFLRIYFVFQFSHYSTIVSYPLYPPSQVCGSPNHAALGWFFIKLHVVLYYLLFSPDVIDGLKQAG
jgi:hypothetical protein